MKTSAQMALAANAFGASGAGLLAAQESYLYTLEAFSMMLDHLAPSDSARGAGVPRGIGQARHSSGPTVSIEIKSVMA